MKLTYDEAADTIIVMLAEADVIDRKEIAPGVYADYDSRGRLISLEALKASEKYDLEESNRRVWPLTFLPPPQAPLWADGRSRTD